MYVDAMVSFEHNHGVGLGLGYSDSVMRDTG